MANRKNKTTAEYKAAANEKIAHMEDAIKALQAEIKKMKKQVASVDDSAPRAVVGRAAAGGRSFHVSCLEQWATDQARALADMTDPDAEKGSFSWHKPRVYSW